MTRGMPDRLVLLAILPSSIMIEWGSTGPCCTLLVLSE